MDNKKLNKCESIMQYYYQMPKYDIGINTNKGYGIDREEVTNCDDYEPTLFPNQINYTPDIKKITTFNNTEDIRRINSYMDFLYENGDVYVDGTWYKTPYDAIRQYEGGIVGIKQALFLGKVFRRLGLDRTY